MTRKPPPKIRGTLRIVRKPKGTQRFRGQAETRALREANAASVRAIKPGSAEAELLDSPETNH